jgi:antitoxin CptB
MNDAELGLYDSLLGENDQDLYRWVTGQAAAPEALAGLIGAIAACAGLPQAGERAG